MTATTLFPFFLIGLMGSVHCIGMCGGIVSALSVASPPRRPFPVAVRLHESAGSERAASPAPSHIEAFDNALRVVAYNTGRIGSYVLAGAAAGGMLGGLRTMSGMAGLQVAGHWLANLMLIALGLYLMNVWRGLARVEAAGQFLWRRVQPLIRHFLPMDTPARALALGSLWGWVPCGMVYSMLTTAMLSGSSASGALVMLAFGLGTLPMLLAMGIAGGSLRSVLRRRAIRIACGMVVLSFGLAGVARVAGHAVVPAGWLDTLCVTPEVHANHVKEQR
jgi:sulfite exporter TauE/SafE